jgi:proton-translocating NAD(P)+ transhydrogenase subunit alpha
MSLSVGVLREKQEGETRISLVPEVASKYLALGVGIMVESHAGEAAHIGDDDWPTGVRTATREEILANCPVVLHVQPLPTEDISRLPAGAISLGFQEPHANDDRIRALASGDVSAFSVELVPRISRAQSMDALSSQAAVAGYRSALIAAQTLDRFLPMLTTAAGTIRPAQVLVIGAGVAGLQAIATAKRLGAQVSGYDVRAAAREQVESLGARFVVIDVSAEGSGGYARELTDEEKRKQRDALAEHVMKADAVITTAAIPGRPAPRIIDAEMVAGMKSGAVIVDLAAETGGNCELTKAGETVVSDGVSIVGPANLPASLARHASEMYARNLLNFLTPHIKDGGLDLNWDDEVIASSALTHGGDVKHGPTAERIGT